MSGPDDRQPPEPLPPYSTPGPEPRLFVLAYLHAWVCAPVRILEPQRWLNTIPGVRAVSVEPGEPLDLACSEEKKVLIWQRAVQFNRLEFLATQKELLRRGYLIVAEFDDDPEYFSDVRVHNYMVFSTCHCVQTSTETLAAELRRHNPHVQVFANQLSELPPTRVYPRTDPLTLFYGAQNRQPDWRPLMPALNRVLAKHLGQVRVRVIWDREFFDTLQTPHKEFSSFCPYERYKQAVGDCDIALLPLNLTRFNCFKSDLKFVECAGHGAAVLASPTVYQRTVRNEETGLLFRSPEEFESQLTRLIEDCALRTRLAKAAYEYVAQNRLLQQHFRERFDWYLKMFDDLPRLNADLRERASQFFDA